MTSWKDKLLKQIIFSPMEAYHTVCEALLAACDDLKNTERQRDDLATALENLLPLAAQAWAKHDADATEYYTAANEARALLAHLEEVTQ